MTGPLAGLSPAGKQQLVVVVVAVVVAAVAAAVPRPAGAVLLLPGEVG